MVRVYDRHLVLLVSFCCWQCVQPTQGQDVSQGAGPTLKFFYFDQRETEWVVSSEPERLASHLEKNSDSAGLYESLQATAGQAADTQSVRATMGNWIEGERERFDESNSRQAYRLRVAEGVTAYMRAHDFNVGALVEALLKRSGATGVELVAIHLIDEAGQASYKLKVMLPEAELELNRQGFDVVLQSSRVTNASVVYALALALYEIHEIINDEASGDSSPESSKEQVPIPETLPGPTETPLDLRPLIDQQPLLSIPPSAAT